MEVKERVHAVVNEQPDDSTLEEIAKEIVFLALVDKGLADDDAGRTRSHDSMKDVIRSWHE